MFLSKSIKLRFLIRNILTLNSELPGLYLPRVSRQKLLVGGASLFAASVKRFRMLQENFSIQK